MWVVAKTKGGQENRAFKNLDNQGFDAFLPRFETKQFKNNTWLPHHELMFPGYIFINLDSNFNKAHKINNTLGVHKLLMDSHSGSPSILPDNVISEISNGINFPINYKLGVMVETPRAALKADELAKISSFLSFGTNDLTQMTYGLSRDDSGTFMRDYLERGIFPVDPFRSLDLDGVGELLKIASKKSRDANPSIKIGMCGEHGGDPKSIDFCKTIGLDFVSCSPFRVPIARIAAAQ